MANKSTNKNGKGWHKEIPRHQKVALEAWAKKKAENSTKLSPIDPKTLINQNEIKSEPELQPIPSETEEKIDELYYNEGMLQRGYSTSGGESYEISGHQEDLPYYLTDSDVEFDSNAGYEQGDMNDAMSRLLESVNTNINELKEDMGFAWNSDSDSYLSFISVDVEMPKESLPIMHYDDDSEDEIQIESVEDEYKIKNVAQMGVSLEQFQKYLEDQWFLDDDLMYVLTQTTSVAYIPKKTFLDIIQKKADESGVQLDQADLKIVKDYKQ